MNADEPARVERCGQFLDRLAEHQIARPSMQAGVVVCRVDPLDLLHSDEYILVFLRQEDSLRVLRSVLHPR